MSSADRVRNGTANTASYCSIQERPDLARSYAPERVKGMYRRVAWYYDAWGKLTEGVASRRLLELAAVRDGSQILEVAVGTGRLFAEIAALNPSGHLEGIELSGDMLIRAQSRLQESAISASYRLQEGDAYKLPFADASFDYLFNAYMLDLLPVADFPRLFHEFGRVLKPGGTLAIANFSYGKNRANRIWYWLARTAPGLLTDCRPIRPERLLEKAGFEIFHQEEISQNTFPSSVVLARKRN